MPGCYRHGSTALLAGHADPLTGGQIERGEITAPHTACIQRLDPYPGTIRMAFKRRPVAEQEADVILSGIAKPGDETCRRTIKPLPGTEIETAVGINETHPRQYIDDTTQAVDPFKFGVPAS